MMRSRACVLAVLILVSGVFCQLARPVPATSTPAPTPTPFPTGTPAPVSVPPAAILYEQKFDTTPLQSILNKNGDWSVMPDEAGNHTYCSGVSDNWQTFSFGYETWTDYAVELRVEFLEQNANESAEVYARINSAAEGYRGQLSSSRAGLAYYAPVEALGGAPITTQANHWYLLRIEVAGSQIQFYLDNQPMARVTDTRQSEGTGGFGVAPGTAACVADIRVWALTADGQIAQEAPADQVARNDSLAKYEGNSAFSFVDGSDPSMPVWDSAAQGFKPQPADARKQTVLDENFVVPANQVTTFENQIVFVRPHQRHDMHVYGTLIIKNSLLLWQPTENQQSALLIEKGGKLVIQNSYAFQGNPFWFSWYFEDGSTVSFDHFVGTPWCSMHGSVNFTATNFSTVELTIFGDVHDSRVEIANAHHVEFEFFPPPGGTYQFSLPEKNQWANWQIANVWPRSSLQMTHSYLWARNISLDANVHVTILNALDGVNIGWGIHKDTPGFVSCELKGLGEPGNDQGVLYQNATWDLPCINSSLTMKNSLLGTAWPNTWGYVHLKVSDSNLFDPRNWGPPSTFEIYGSSIYFLGAYSGGLIYLEDCKVKSGIQVNGSGSTVYGYGVTSADPANPFAITQESGGRYIALSSAGPPWK